MQRLLADLQGHSLAWPFVQPVDETVVEDYYEVIKKPMGTPRSVGHSLSLKLFFYRTRSKHDGAQAGDEPIWLSETFYG